MQDRNGKFFLQTRGKKSLYSICWYEQGAIQRLATGTSDRQAACIKLAEHALKADRPLDQKDATLASILNRYWLDRGQHLSSAESFRQTMRHALTVSDAEGVIFGDEIMVSQVTILKQKRFIAALRRDNYSDGSIMRWLTTIFTAINASEENQELRSVPVQISSNKWEPYIPNRERVLSIQELATLFNVAATNERWWRYLILAISTGARPGALRDLTWAQVNMQDNCIQLNPDGRKQNKKRRPIVAMCSTLRSWIGQWGPGYLLTYEGRPLRTISFFREMRAKVGFEVVAYNVRHTVRTWLAREGVNDSEADAFMGHRGQGSAMGARYTHMKPDYMQACRDALDRLFIQIAPLVTQRNLLVHLHAEESICLVKQDADETSQKSSNIQTIDFTNKGRVNNLLSLSLPMIKESS